MAVKGRVREVGELERNPEEPLTLFLNVRLAREEEIGF